MRLEGKITISRTGSSDGSNSIRIEIVDAGSRVSFVVGEMTMHNFSMAVTGHGYMPISLETRGLDVVGMLAEHKAIEIPFEEPRWINGHQQNEAAAQAAVKPFETDGWLGDWRAFFNDHNRGNTSATRNVFRVSFHRYVPRPEGSIDE